MKDFMNIENVFVFLFWFHGSYLFLWFFGTIIYKYQWYYWYYKAKIMRDQLVFFLRSCTAQVSIRYSTAVFAIFYLRTVTHIHAIFRMFAFLLCTWFFKKEFCKISFFIQDINIIYDFIDNANLFQRKYIDNFNIYI